MELNPRNQRRQTLDKGNGHAQTACMKCPTRYAFLLLGFLAASSLLIAADTGKGKLTNASVAEMVKAGLGESVVVQAIEGGKCEFDLSPAALIQLKKDGVPDSVIAAMQKASKPSAATAPSAGARPAEAFNPMSVTLVDGDKRIGMQSSQGNNRSSGGPFGGAGRRVLVGAKSATRIQTTTPAFEFMLPSSVRPEEQVALLLPEVKKDERRIETMRVSVFAGAREGKNRKVDLKIEEVSNASAPPTGTFLTYRAVPVAPLAPGEYVFLKQSFHLFDFGVDAK